MMRPASLPDTSTHVNRFEIKSETSNRIYVVAQSRAGRWWSCSCNGWIRHKTCKHLRALGLPSNHQPFEPPKPRKDTMPKKTFAEIDAARKRYDPAAEGFGETAEWVKQFGERMGYEEATRVIRACSESPRKILGLGEFPTWPEVRAVYRVLIRNSHPDRAAERGETTEQAVEACRKINAAYAVLARELGQ